MSSYICEPEHFNSVERKLIDLIEDVRLGSFFRDSLGLKGDKEVRDRLNVVVGNLMELNVISVSLELRERGESFGELNTRVSSMLGYIRSIDKYKDLSIHGLYNGLRCLSYQIETDKLKKVRALDELEVESLRFLELVIRELAAVIVDRLPEDGTNTWSIQL